MTAIGFGMFILFGFAFAAFDQYEHGWRDHAKNAVALGTISGLILIVAGVATWLWRVMP